MIPTSEMRKTDGYLVQENSREFLKPYEDPLKTEKCSHTFSSFSLKVVIPLYQKLLSKITALSSLLFERLLFLSGNPGCIPL